MECQRAKRFFERSHIKATGDYLKQKRLSSRYLTELGFRSAQWGRTYEGTKITYQSNTEVLPFVNPSVGTKLICDQLHENFIYCTKLPELLGEVTSREWDRGQWVCREGKFIIEHL